MTRAYQMCTRCIMDTSNHDITFDENGVCNHCHEYDTFIKQFIYTGKEGEEKLKALVTDIKKDGRGKKYDCIIGVSGGVDSTYTLYLARQQGLRPLAVSIDNDYDTE